MEDEHQEDDRENRLPQLTKRPGAGALSFITVREQECKEKGLRAGQATPAGGATEGRLAAACLGLEA